MHWNVTNLQPDSIRFYIALSLTANDLHAGGVVKTLMHMPMDVRGGLKAQHRCTETCTIGVWKIHSYGFSKRILFPDVHLTAFWFFSLFLLCSFVCLRVFCSVMHLFIGVRLPSSHRHRWILFCESFLRIKCALSRIINPWFLWFRFRHWRVASLTMVWSVEDGDAKNLIDCCCSCAGFAMAHPPNRYRY